MNAALRRTSTSGLRSHAMPDIVAALNVLPDDERALLTYHIVRDLDLVAIASALHLRLGETKARLSVALQHFEAALAFVSGARG